MGFLNSNQIFTTAKEVVISLACVWLLAGLYKNYATAGRVTHGPSKKALDFDGNPDNVKALFGLGRFLVTARWGRAVPTTLGMFYLAFL